MGNFFAELRRRHIYRIGAGYVVVAWALTQVIDVLSQIYALPDWIAQPLVATLALGLPITLGLAWLIEGKAHEAVASAVRSPASTIDYALFGAVAVVIGLIGYQQLTPEPVVVAAIDEEIAEFSDRLPNSIAVLPFANLSPDPDNAYFAAGIHDTLLNELAKISDMNVISRTSVLGYADGQTTIPQIADELNVETVMEGTVQYADGQVRITAQLIDPETGAHLWSENYDRDFSGIFAIQTEIASNIAMALEAELLAAEQESIEQPLTDSPEAYAAYLKAIVVIQGGFEVAASPDTRLVIQNYLDEALRLDPEFASAYAWKARLYIESRNYDPVTEEDWPDFRSEMEQLAFANADRALALDPSIGLAHGARAIVHYGNWRAGPALMEAEQALRLSPNDPDVLILYSEVLIFTQGQIDEAIRVLRRAEELDPKSTLVLWDLGLALRAAGRFAEASDVFRECLALNPRSAECALFLARTEFARGNREAALEALRRTEQSLVRDAAPAIRADITYGYGLIGQSEDAQRAFDIVTELAAERYVHPLAWAWAYMGIRDYDEAFRQLNLAAENKELNQSPGPAFFVVMNDWSDPMLEQADFVEVRDRLRAR
jgi:TolB-like protein/thioredoxin-like negative regulator of GroEL